MMEDTVDITKAVDYMREKRERECFGCTIQEMRDSLIFLKDDKVEDLLMLSMSIQSDCQEMLERDYDRNEIRQYLNRSKYWLAEISRILNKEKAK